MLEIFLKNLKNRAEIIQSTPMFFYLHKIEDVDCDESDGKL